MRCKVFNEYDICKTLIGFQVQYVRDPDVAVAVMKQSDCKGYVLERVLSCPAWAPIISLERYARNVLIQVLLTPPPCLPPSITLYFMNDI